MIKHHFSLKPFGATSRMIDFKIIGSVSRQSNRFFIQYELIGQITEIMIPLPAIMPCRKHNLWEDTCFEFFLSAEGFKKYWEFNLSPSKDWNVYKFEFYRQKEMKEETAFASLPFQVKNNSKSLLLNLELELDKIDCADQSLEIGISSVIKLKNNDLSYWSLTHPSTKPDFHNRAGFIIKL